MKKRSDALIVLGFYWRAASRYPRLLVVSIIFVPLVTLTANVLPPLVVAEILQRLSQHAYQAHDVWGSFGGLLVLYAILLLTFNVFAWRIIDACMWRLEAHVQQDLAEQVFKHLLRQSADFHANTFSGSLVSQTNKLLGSYVRISDTTTFQTYPMIATITFMIAILATRAWPYALILAVFTVVYVISAFFVTRKVRAFAAMHAEAESEQTGALADAITNVMAIKSFARMNYEKRRFGAATSHTKKRLLKVMSAAQLQQTYFTGITNSISVLALVAAVIGVVSFGANIGAVFLIVSYTGTIVSSLFSFSNNSLRNYNRSIGDAKDMIDILSLEPSVLDPVRPEKLRIKDGSIGFKDVVFQHDGASDALFNGLGLAIKNGEKIGLVGHSGSGKTTFTRLLLRFSDIDGGEIVIDGQNIAHITQDDLHSQIAYVPQEPLLFHRSIRENIAYGKLDASDEAIALAAKQAHAAEFIDELPHGYDTLVGERGVKLSGGQRQRIAIARAMLKNAPILVLDEATSALDSESEVLIQDALWKLMEGRTTIVIAHRLSTIQKMDRIIVLDDGKIVEEGSHHKLLAAKGTYAKLWAHQSGGFIED